MKLVALVKDVNGELDIVKMPINGEIVWSGVVQEDTSQGASILGVEPVIVDAPEVAAKEPKASTKLADFHMTKLAVMDRLLGKDRHGMYIENLGFGHEKFNPESAPFGEIIVFCTATYKDEIFEVNAKSNMKKSALSIANYLRDLIWERLEKRRINLDRNLGMQNSN